MKLATFLVKAKNGREAVMRLPVGKYGSINKKAFDMVRGRLGEGLNYALNLEAFSSADALIDSLNRYKRNTL